MRKNADRSIVDAGRGAKQDHRSCALSLVAAFAMGYSRRQLLANAAIAASRVVAWPWLGVRSDFPRLCPKLAAGVSCASAQRPRDKRWAGPVA